MRLPLLLLVLFLALCAAPAATAAPRELAPGIALDAEARTVDLTGTVVGRDVDWLELVACTPGSREHESLVTVDAAPSMIHLALLTLGLEPGRPLHRDGDWRIDPDAPLVAPTGPPVTLWFIVGDAEPVPAIRWVEGAADGNQNIWLFTGSEFRTWRGREEFLADLNGTVASLVSFGDDLLARPSTLTDTTDQQQFRPSRAAMPENGTPITLRIRVPDAGVPAERPG